MSQRAQIQGQIFVFLLALVIVGVILFLGYKGVDMMIKQGDKVQLDEFKRAVIDDAKLYQDYGSTSEAIKYTLPSSIKYVCFLEMGAYNLANEICTPASDSYQSLACDAWDKKTASVFTIPPKISDLKITTLNVQGGAFCAETVLGNIKVTYEGLGDKTLIKKA